MDRTAANARAPRSNLCREGTCVNAGYERLKPRAFDLVGNLDADITFAPDYYEFLVGKFAEMAGLGVAGTPFVEDSSGLRTTPMRTGLRISSMSPARARCFGGNASRRWVATRGSRAVASIGSQ